MLWFCNCFTVWQVKAAACGVLRVEPAATSNSTLSVSTVSTPECTQQPVLASASGGHSCSRCPIVSPETQYDVLLVAEASGTATAKPVHITVSQPLRMQHSLQHQAVCDSCGTLAAASVKGGRWTLARPVYACRLPRCLGTPVGHRC